MRVNWTPFRRVFPAPLGQNELVTEHADIAADDDEVPPLPGVDGGLLDPIMPVILFLVLNRLAGLPWAIAAATLWSLKVAVQRKRRGSPIGKFLPIITVGIVARGILGIVTDSEAVYFGIGIGTKAAVGLVLIGGAVIGRNLLAYYAPVMFGFTRRTTGHPIYVDAMQRVAVVAGLSVLLSAAFDIWLFNNSSVSGYLVIRTLVNWPFNTALVFGSFWYLGRRLADVPGFPGLNALLEQRMAEYEEAVKARRGAAPSD